MSIKPGAEPPTADLQARAKAKPSIRGIIRSSKITSGNQFSEHFEGCPAIARAATCQAESVRQMTLFDLERKSDPRARKFAFEKVFKTYGTGHAEQRRIGPVGSGRSTQWAGTPFPRG